MSIGVFRRLNYHDASVEGLEALRRLKKPTGGTSGRKAIRDGESSLHMRQIADGSDSGSTNRNNIANKPRLSTRFSGRAAVTRYEYIRVCFVKRKI